MKKKQLLALSLAAIIGTTTLGGSLSTVQAAENGNVISSKITMGEYFNKDYTMSEDELKAYGLSDSEIEGFNNFVLSEINVQNGNISGNNIGDLNDGVQTRGKFSSAVKLIRKAYRKLPKKVKKLIAQYTKLETLLNLIEHYTGALEDGIYNACRTVGMPKNVANFVAKTIMLFVF